MKPCRKNQKQIVWLVMDALDNVQAAELKSHLQRCDGCQVYRSEIELLRNNLVEMDLATEIQAKESLHRRIMTALSENQAETGGPAISLGVQRLRMSWRAAVQTACVVAVGILILAALASRHEAPHAPSAQTHVIPIPTEHPDVLPTIANYRAIANQSLDQLDELLTRQSKRPIPSPPSFSAATLALVNVPD